ncbi:hypothetical protein HPB50_000940 [Hyalomma asiaticum]|uniref:Uncharacterized protein n=1 Tax=Hyalomma asiaticum TaxID=266040 RepID=A0ACB7SJJ0_HYAAI|nr:hypothetical protein HPB50_000940 [Hyalomma asiaticum]
MTAETPLPIVHGDTVKESDDHVDEMSDSLVRNIRNVPVLDPESRDLRSKAFRAIEAAKFFVLLKSDFALMPYVFTFPFFHASATTVLNYAGVGFVAAYALAKLFLRAYGASASETMQKGLHCMMNRSAYGLTEDVEEDVVMLRVLAAKISLDAYVHEIERESHEVPVNGLEAYTGLQLFFLASCYALCPGSAERADHGAQCNAHLQQMEEFARAFDCAPGTPMNPQPKCTTM